MEGYLLVGFLECIPSPPSEASNPSLALDLFLCIFKCIIVDTFINT